MQKITEIILGNSTYYTMSNSSLNKNNIIKFNTMFSVADFSLINEFKLVVDKDISKNLNIYNFSNQMRELDNAILNNDKIRVWSSNKDSDCYILLCFICNYLSNKNINLYVIYSDMLDSKYVSPSLLDNSKIEEALHIEQKLSNDDIQNLSNVWNNVLKQKADIRIMKDNRINFVSYKYFDNIIMDELKKEGTVKKSKLVSNLIFNYYHISDLVYNYSIDRLIKNNNIKIVEKSDREFDDLIKINE